MRSKQRDNCGGHARNLGAYIIGGQGHQQETPNQERGKMERNRGSELTETAVVGIETVFLEGDLVHGFAQRGWIEDGLSDEQCGLAHAHLCVRG